MTSENPSQLWKKHQRLPNALCDIWDDLSKREQDSALAVCGRYMMTGEWNEDGVKLPKSTLTLLKLDCERVFDLEEKRAAAGSRGGSKAQANRKQTSSKAQANRKQTSSKGSSKINQRERERERENMGDNSPIPPQAKNAREVASPEQEAANLGYVQFAFAAAELRKLLPPGVKVAAVYAAADAKGFTGDELLAWANYHASNRWRTGSGTGTLIGPDNIAATIGRWAAQRDNFRKNNGFTNDGTNTRTGPRRVGPLTQAQLLDGDPLD